MQRFASTRLHQPPLHPRGADALRGQDLRIQPPVILHRRRLQVQVADGISPAAFLQHS